MPVKQFNNGVFLGFVVQFAGTDDASNASNPSPASGSPNCKFDTTHGTSYNIQVGKSHRRTIKVVIMEKRMSDIAKLKLNGAELDLSITKGSEGEIGLDISGSTFRSTY